MGYAVGGALFSAALSVAIALSDDWIVYILGATGLAIILGQALKDGRARSRHGKGGDLPRETSGGSAASTITAAAFKATPEMERQIAATLKRSEDARKEHRREIDRLIQQGERLREQLSSSQVLLENPVVGAEEWEEQVCMTLERIPRMDLKTDFQRPVAPVDNSLLSISPSPHTMQVKIARLRIIARKL